MYNILYTTVTIGHICIYRCWKHTVGTYACMANHTHKSGHLCIKKCLKHTVITYECMASRTHKSQPHEHQATGDAMCVCMCVCVCVCACVCVCVCVSLQSANLFLQQIHPRVTIKPQAMQRVCVCVCGFADFPLLVLQQS